MSEGHMSVEGVEALQTITNNISGAFSLENILGENHDHLEHPGLNGAPPRGWDEADVENPLVDGYCIECEGE